MAKMLIGGEAVDAVGGQTYEVRNPATGEVVDTVAKGDARDVEAAVSAAETAFQEWAAVTPEDRGKTLENAIQLIFGPNPHYFPELLPSRPLIHTASVTLQSDSAIITATAVLLKRNDFEIGDRRRRRIQRLDEVDGDENDRQESGGDARSLIIAAMIS